MKFFKFRKVVVITLILSIFGVFYSAVVFSNSSGNDRHITKKKTIRNMVSTAKNNNWFQGGVYVYKGGRKIYDGSVGFSNRELGVKNSRDSIFSIGSMSKQFTAALIMKLVEKNKLDINDPISKYLPYYQTDCPQFEKITIRQALDMTTNIRDYASFWDFALFNRVPVSPPELINTYACEKTSKPVGEYAYSNTNYFLLGGVIEAVTGMSYAKYLEQEIIAPLNLENTGYFNQDTIVPNAVDGYMSTAEGYSMAQDVSYSVAYSAGALYSTPKDIKSWLEQLLANKLFPASITNQMTTGYNEITGELAAFYPGAEYGFGLMIYKMEVNGKTLNLVGHGGMINGFLAQSWAVNTGSKSQPNWDAYVVVLGNVQNDCFAPAWMATDIISILYGDEAEGPPVDLKTSCEQLGWP